MKMKVQISASLLWMRSPFSRLHFSGRHVVFLGAAPTSTGAEDKIELLHVQGNVYMIAGAGANITVQVGDEFVIVVDSGVPQRAMKFWPRSEA